MSDLIKIKVALPVELRRALKFIILSHTKTPSREVIFKLTTDLQ